MESSSVWYEGSALQTSCNCYILSNGYPMNMPRFLFQPDPIAGYEFNPIPVDIHLGVIKIPTKEILDDDSINNTESIIVGTDRKEVLNRIQTAFAREFQRHGKLRVRYSTDGLCYKTSMDEN